MEKVNQMGGGRVNKNKVGKATRKGRGRRKKGKKRRQRMNKNRKK